MSNLRGLDAIKKTWEFYDPKHRALLEIIAEADWAVFKRIAEMRNNLVHGTRVYELKTCAKEAATGLTSLDNLKTVLDLEYGYSGWSKGKIRRNSKLHSDPAVTWTR